MLKSKILKQVQDLVQHDFFTIFPHYDTAAKGGEIPRSYFQGVIEQKQFSNYHNSF